MPTHKEEDSFWADWDKLSPEQQAQFLAAIDEMIDDLRAQRPFRKGLRVKKFQSAPGVFEMTWAKNGRALFRYGNPVLPGEKHVIWIPIGTHDIFEKQ